MREQIIGDRRQEPKAGSETAGEFLKKRAKEKNISTKELAESLGVHPSTIRRAFRDLGHARTRIGFGMMGIILGYPSAYEGEDLMDARSAIEEDWRKFRELPLT